VQLKGSASAEAEGSVEEGDEGEEEGGATEEEGVMEDEMGAMAEEEGEDRSSWLTATLEAFIRTLTLASQHHWRLKLGSNAKSIPNQTEVRCTGTTPPT
jgi:hypothetical protein